MATKIQPLGPRVLIKRLEEEEQSSGGIIIPDTAKEKPQEAQVVGLGTGGKDENGNDYKFTVKKKDKVLISKYGGTDIKIDGKDLLIVNEVDILAIIG
ncbi:MAG: co-chaperone GroES [Verrucomicrobiales bacterium]|mgnify:FL=1|jgi:chaperonin GroES|nr:co-chaperone GroES [Verrucomicrobiales bacterium]MCH2025126.1 co-chaperone GroES [Verrucomicrobiales bacterium]MEC9036296.1 co-chaperone GroES [Verrucomicrobiota bacterium]HAA86855.1 co-chaperone GroES [Verrucomicrobiales bacterium]|tara:strand:- start:149 stop:442 length:294 start_codon:yes stop_codon:yes gene_type:complete